MKRYRHILIALPGSAADRNALDWSALVAKAAEAERVEAMILDPEPADWVPEYPPVDGPKPWKERVREAAEEIAEVFAGLPQVSLQTKSGVGAPLATVLQELVGGNYDLVVVGVADDHDRRFAEKLARKSPASVLIVPAAAEGRCRSILVPVDFSEPSALALEIAGVFGCALGSERIGCLHSFRVPGRARTPDVNPESLKEAHGESAKNHLANFLERQEASPVTVEHLVRETPAPSSAILEELQERSYDLVVMATRGRNSIVRALLGSNTADVLRGADVPVLAVKAKGEGLAYLRALLGNQENTSLPSAAST